MAIKDYAARRAEREDEAKWNSDQDAAADRAEQKAAERRATEKKDREERLAYQKTGLSFQNVTFEQWKKQQAEKKAAAEERKAQEEEGQVRADAINAKAIELHKIKYKIRDVSAELLELTEGMTAPFASMIGVTEQMLETRQKEVEMDLDILGNAEARSRMGDEQIAQVENRVGLNTSLGDLEKDIMSKAKMGTLEAMSEEEIWNQLKLEGLDITKMTKEELDALTKRVEGIAAGTEKLSEEGMNKLMQKAGMMDSTLKGWKDKADMFGMALKNPAVMMKMLQASAITMAISLAKDLFGGALKFRKELGLGAGEAATLAVNVKAAEMHTKLMGGDAALIAASASEMVKQFGDTSVFTFAIGQDMAGLAVSTGFGGANAAKLLKSMEGISGASIETNINTLEAWGNLAKAEGVSSKIVLDDIASSTKEFAEFAKDGGENIAEAAVHAAKLGLNLGTVVNIADNLLKFESSIQKEMEAEMLIGKQLNLDRARQLALEGKLDELMGEVTDNLVSQAEWSEMNVIQRRALADAIGVSAADMGKMIAGEKTSAQIAEEQVETQAKQMDLQTKLMALASASQGIQLAILLIEQYKTRQGLLQTLNQMKQIVLNRSSMGMNIAQAVLEAAKAAFKNPILAIAGIAAAAAGAAAIYGMVGKAKGHAGGGFAGKDGGEVAPSDTVPAMLTPGELVLNAAQQRNVAGSMGGSTSSTETNQLLSDTKDQNDQVISELKQARIQQAALMGSLKSAIDRIPMN